MYSYSASKFCGQTARRSFGLSQRYLSQRSLLRRVRVVSTPILSGQFHRDPDFLLLHLSAVPGRPNHGSHSLGHFSILKFHTSSSLHEEPSSKVEESVNVIKESKNEPKAIAPKKTIWIRIKEEVIHYYHGFRLLVVDTKICIGLINRVLNGHSLTRREHRQLVRTTSDLFRLVPFSVFVIVPFMELLLPVFLKFFPGMLPSTFQTKNDRENKMKAQLKVKLEMAKFLQKTLDDMSLESKGHTSESAKEFAEFFHKIRTSGTEVSNADIIKYSKLFEDEITLDSLTRQQLTALSRVLELPALGNNTLLRFQLRMRLRSLIADDKSIELEGLDQLTVHELQLACKARGMRAVGVSTDRLRRQMEQWLQLSLHEKVPPSLLLLSRALYLPENLPTSAQLQATLSVLPQSAATQAKAAIGEREGKVDNKTRIEVIKEEERKIIEERQDALTEAVKKGKIVLPETHTVEVPAAVPDLHTEQVTFTVPAKTPAPKAGEVLEPEVQEKSKPPAHPEPAPLATELFTSQVSSEDPITVSEIVLRRHSRHVPHPYADHQKEGLFNEDLTHIREAVVHLGDKQEHMFSEKEEIKDLKEELADYKEDLDDLHDLKKDATNRVEVKESKAAQRLYKKVNNMIAKMDSVVQNLQSEESSLKAQITEEDSGPKKTQLIATEKLIEAIQKFRNVSDPARLERIADVILNLDIDKDGHIEIEDVMRVIELIGRENVKLHPKQVAEIVEILTKEESNLEKQGKLEPKKSDPTKPDQTKKDGPPKGDNDNDGR